MEVKAKDSPEIQKLKERLEMRLQRQSLKINPDALEHTREAIKTEIAHKQPPALKGRKVKKIDSAHEEVHSKFVKKLMRQLSTEPPHT